MNYISIIFVLLDARFPPPQCSTKIALLHRRRNLRLVVHGSALPLQEPHDEAAEGNGGGNPPRLSSSTVGAGPTPRPAAAGSKRRSDGLPEQLCRRSPATPSPAAAPATTGRQQRFTFCCWTTTRTAESASCSSSSDVAPPPPPPTATTSDNSDRNVAHRSADASICCRSRQTASSSAISWLVRSCLFRPMVLHFSSNLTHYTLYT